MRRDEQGMRKARKHGWVYVLVKYPEGDIKGGMYTKPKWWSSSKTGLDLFTVSDYDLITSGLGNEPKRISAGEWNRMVDWRILGLANIIVNN